MSKTWICLMFLVAGTLSVLSAGCSKSDPLAAAGKRLIGVWKGKAPAKVEVSGSSKQQEEMDIGCEFKKDGTVTMDILLPVSGTWELVKAEGDKITVKMVLEMPKMSGESKMENGKVTETTKVATTKETQEFSVVFETDDRIVMAPTEDPQEKATLERQKK